MSTANLGDDAWAKFPINFMVGCFLLVRLGGKKMFFLLLSVFTLETNLFLARQPGDAAIKMAISVYSLQIVMNFIRTIFFAGGEH